MRRIARQYDGMTYTHTTAIASRNCINCYSIDKENSLSHCIEVCKRNATSHNRLYVSSSSMDGPSRNYVLASRWLLLVQGKQLRNAQRCTKSFWPWLHASLSVSLMKSRKRVHVEPLTLSSQPNATHTRHTYVRKWRVDVPHDAVSPWQKRLCVSVDLRLHGLGWC